MDNSRNKIDILYLFLAASVLLHVVLVAIPWMEQEKKKEKEPIIVDLQGPLKWGQVTQLPAPLASPPPLPMPSQPPAPPRERTGVARAFPVRRPVPAPPPAPSAVPGQSQASSPVPSSGEPRPGAAPQPSSPDGYYEPTPPRRLIKPTIEDLNRYAKVDRTEQDAKSETVTLDTQDLMYTSYMQGLKRRIEDIWKYPETARRDGVQGDLVMKFSISKSGRVVDIELVKSSGYPMLDDAAIKALNDASPFNPLPENWKKQSFTITGTFIYRLYGLSLR